MLAALAEGYVALSNPAPWVEYEPERSSSVTTLALDTDYLIDPLIWQDLGLLPDRSAARDLATELCTEPVQVLRAGESTIEQWGPICDELVALTQAPQGSALYFGRTRSS